MISNAKSPDLTLHIKTVKRSIRIPIPFDNQIVAIAGEDGQKYTDAVLSLLQRGIKQYVHKKGEFYCQSCSRKFGNKKMHVVPIGFEEFIFCDDCFFSDKYKEFIRRIL